MSRRHLLALVLLFCATAYSETVRFALVAGNNAGSGQVAPLRFAENDARKVARLLLELGDVAPDHLQLLQGLQVAAFEEAIARMRRQVEEVKRSPENRAVVLVYFSGHSDGEGLELGSEVLLYSRLKTMLAGVGDVRVVIVDACKAGSGFREKGAKAVEPFAIKLTDSLNSTGDAYIASSAESEAALESNEVLGSIFTHHLVSGLRGVADTSGDHLVTLGEAYRYAYDQTVARTVLSPVGTQHPSYDYALSGQGELVLTTLQRATSQLVVPVGTERAVIIDVRRDQVIAELPSANVREVFVAAGEYGVRVFKAGQSFGGRVVVPETGRKEIAWSELAPISSLTPVALKGATVEQVVQEPEQWREQRLVGLQLGVVPALTPLGLQGAMRISFDPRLSTGLSFALVGARTQRGTVSENAIEARVGWRYAWRFHFFWLGLGAEAGPALILQDTGSGLRSSLAGVATPRLIARFFVGGPFVITIEGEAGVAIYGLNGQVAVAFRPSATAGLGIRF